MTPHMMKLVASACLSLAVAATSVQFVWVAAASGGTAAPGALAFSSARYGVTEEAGTASIRLKRVGGTEGEAVGRVTLTDVTTSPADYRFTPGARDPTFNPGGSGASTYPSLVFAMAVQPDEKIIIGGRFTAYNGDESAPDTIMRLNADGTPDTTFNADGAGANNYASAVAYVWAVALQPDGKIIIGGEFASYNGDFAASDMVMRLNADGTPDTTFNVGGSGVDGSASVRAVALQTDGKIIIGGDFTSYNGDGSANDYVMRLNADGTRDATFNSGGSGANSNVWAVALQTDGKIVIGGSFDTYNGDTATNRKVMRLNADGTRDATFNPGGVGADAFLLEVALQPDGKILVGGLFTVYDGDEAANDYVMRLNADGTRDMTFNPGGRGLNGSVYEAALQPDGKIIIGGSFTTYNHDFAASDYVMRLNADGTPDMTFNAGGAGADSQVSAVSVRPDGKIIIGGYFDTYNGDAAISRKVMRLDGDLFATWRAGDAAEKVVRLPIVNDGIAEADETLTLTLSVVSGGAALGSPHSATLTIGPRNPIDDDSNFVRQHYYDVLNRDPDDPGLAFWTDQMTNCGNPNPEVCRVNVSAAFFFSIEFQHTGYLVERMYRVAYGAAAGDSVLDGAHQFPVPIMRLNDFLPDTQQIGRNVVVGVGDWERQLESNKQAFALDFIRRQRFKDAYPATMTASEFVSNLDRNAGGVLTQGERDGLVASLGANPGDDTRRAQVLRAVAENAVLAREEFARAFVLMQYFSYLRRDPDAAPDSDHTGYDYWLRKLDGFGGDFIRAEMVKAFITSDEYRRRFAQ